jgi:hypothetical protein
MKTRAADFGLIFGLIGGLKADIQTRIEPNQEIKNSAKNMLIVTMITVISAFPFKLGLRIFIESTGLRQRYCDSKVGGCTTIALPPSQRRPALS